MAHLGKKYPYLFERDLSMFGTTFRTKLARRYEVKSNSFNSTSLFQGWLGWKLTSEPGVANYDFGTVSWRFNPPPDAPAESYLDLVYRLTFDLNEWSVDRIFHRSDGFAVKCKGRTPFCALNDFVSSDLLVPSTWNSFAIRWPFQDFTARPWTGDE